MVISCSRQTFDSRKLSEIMVNPFYHTTSIVIRACNEEKHIAQLLEGIARQSLTDVEIILVDSGSTDRTLEIASQYPRQGGAYPAAGFHLWLFPQPGNCGIARVS